MTTDLAGYQQDAADTAYRRLLRAFFFGTAYDTRDVAFLKAMRLLDVHPRRGRVANAVGVDHEMQLKADALFAPPEMEDAYKRLI